ncbi:MAG: DUF58 domain-containing protein [Nanoarchaeota archaeon]|nr:DUF58 domain-containing protein [Nanoarchaeota archaeon]
MKQIKVDFAPLVKQLEIQAKKNIIISGMTGQYRSVFKGRGMEFEGYRKYDQSDDARMIDWKASLRSKQPVVRELIEERQLETLFVFDVSSSMLFASTEKLKCEYAAELIATMGFAIIQGGDAAGLLMFSDHKVFQVNMATGPRQYYLMTRALENPKLYEGEYDLDRMLDHLIHFTRRNTTIVMVSDFIGVKGDWRGKLKIAARKFDLIGIMIRDPRDITMPEVGQVVISDPYTSKEMVIDTKRLKDHYADAAKKQIEEVQAAFKEAGADLLFLVSDQGFIKPMREFFMWRRAKWR